MQIKKWHQLLKICNEGNHSHKSVWTILLVHIYQKHKASKVSPQLWDFGTLSTVVSITNKAVCVFSFIFSPQAVSSLDHAQMLYAIETRHRRSHSCLPWDRDIYVYIVYLLTSHHRTPTILIFVTKITMLMTRLSQRLISAASISLCCVYTQLLLLLLCGDVCLIDGGVSLTTAILATCR